MLKMIKLSKKLASNRNNSNRATFEKNNSNSEVDRFGDSIKYTKKLEI